MEATNTFFSNVTTQEKENDLLKDISVCDNELAVASEEISPGDIWEWNLMYGIGTDVY
jgi:hypothetical protein